MWVTKKNVGKKLEDIPAPFSDVKNILKEIEFKDKATRSRCRGWLVLPSRKYLQANILFPGCAFDCRLHVRGRIGTIFCYEYVSGSITLHARVAQCQYSTVMTICLLVYLDFSITPLCTVLSFN